MKSAKTLWWKKLQIQNESSIKRIWILVVRLWGLVFLAETNKNQMSEKEEEIHENARSGTELFLQYAMCSYWDIALETFLHM